MDCNCFRPAQGVKVKSFDVSAYIFQQRCGSDDTENQQIQIILEKNRGRKIDKTVVV